jgi:hypothetical protein
MHCEERPSLRPAHVLAPLHLLVPEQHVKLSQQRLAREGRGNESMPDI